MSELQVSLQQSDPFDLNVSLQCASGELLALVGPSGSGKSTVLRTIAGLHQANFAHIQCNGQCWEDTNTRVRMKPQDRKVGLVFQDYALFPHKSVLANVLLATPGKNKTENREKARVLLQKTNMAGMEDRMPATLSGGQKQRVALARALAREPGVLLLDEPFSAVDQQTRRRLYSELAALRKTLDLPIILVTHDLTEVQLLADSLCLMRRGNSLQRGTVVDVINSPTSREIAKLVGHQNLFNADVVSQQPANTVYRIGALPAFIGPKLDTAQVDKPVCLLIFPTAISLQREPGQDSAIKLDGKIQEMLILGDEISIRMHLNDVPKSLRFKIPLYTAQQQSLKKGDPLSVYINPQNIHAMHS